MKMDDRAMKKASLSNNLAGHPAINRLEISLINRVMKRLNQLSRSNKRHLALMLDVIMISLALWASLAPLAALPVIQFSHYVWMLLFGPPLTILILYRLKMYHTVIRFMDVRNQWVLAKGISYAAALLLMLSIAINGFHWYLVEVLPIFWMLAVLSILGLRQLFRILTWRYATARPAQLSKAVNIAIYGAGEAGVRLASSLLKVREYQCIAFIDEKKEFSGTHILGLPVFNLMTAPAILDRLAVKEVWLAVPNASAERRKHLLLLFENWPVRVKLVPELGALLSGDMQVHKVRDVEIDDLLGRNSVPAKAYLLDQCVRGKSVLVTGAGGSIGSELCRQILNLHPRHLILYELNEYALYLIHQELAGQLSAESGVQVTPILGSVNQQGRLKSIFRHFGVQTVYHTAAYKHVPLIEYNLIQGVQNNIFGTWCCAQAAEATRVETFVLISTDKAVRPTNVMGATKRFAELILQGMAARARSTRFCMVRFGNVLGSSGSVIPLFKKQIKEGGPVTVTHPEITRYFMTIPEAAQLVLQAGALGCGGEIFLLDMGKPVKILDLARRMIQLSGLKVKDAEYPEGDIEIEITGLRPGEKLYEELLIDDTADETEHPLIMRATEHDLPWPALLDALKQLNVASQNMDCSTAREILLQCIEDYHPQGDIADYMWRSERARVQAMAGFAHAPGGKDACR